MPHTVHLTQYAKRKIGEAMYHRGKSFLAASALLEQKGGYGYVVLHLWCQGLEVVLKSFLLIRDYDKYRLLLTKYGHNLLRLSKKACSSYSLKPLRHPLRQELKTLNELYMRHVLRYADARDIFIDPNAIEVTRVAKRTLACIRLADRALLAQRVLDPKANH